MFKRARSAILFSLSRPIRMKMIMNSHHKPHGPRVPAYPGSQWPPTLAPTLPLLGERVGVRRTLRSKSKDAQILRCARSAIALSLGFTLLALPCHADELADKGRALFKKNQHAVVTVQIVLKSKFSMGGRGGQSNESRQD